MGNRGKQFCTYWKPLTYTSANINILSYRGFKLMGSHVIFTSCNCSAGQPEGRRVQEPN